MSVQAMFETAPIVPSADRQVRVLLGQRSTSTDTRNQTVGWEMGHYGFDAGSSATRARSTRV